MLRQKQSLLLHWQTPIGRMVGRQSFEYAEEVFDGCCALTPIAGVAEVNEEDGWNAAPQQISSSSSSSTTNSCSKMRGRSKCADAATVLVGVHDEFQGVYAA